MPLTQRKGGTVSEVSIIGQPISTTNTDTTTLTNEAIDAGVQLRSRILNNATFNQNDYSGSFNSLFLDGISNTVERTTGMPLTSNNNIVTFPSTTGTTAMRIASTSASDVGFSVFIKGLDTNWEPISTSVVMNGQTTVLIDTEFKRIIHKMFVYNLDGTGLTENVGDIFIGGDDGNWTAGQPNAASPVYYVIQAEYNWSSMGVTSVPAQTFAYFSKGNDYSDGTPAKPVTFKEIHTYPWDTSLPNVNRIPLIIGHLRSTSNTSFNADYGGADIPYTDIEFRAQSDTGQNQYSVYWELYQVSRSTFN